MDLFRTEHGSHLYGLAHAGSDRDYYTVVERRRHIGHNGTRARYARQTMVGREDNFVIDLSTFMLLCDKGVPQALEAMFAPNPSLDLIGALRRQYRASTAVIPTYLRTIKSFAMKGDYKRKRHALRLALNANRILHTGRFNPTLEGWEVALVTEAAHASPEEVLEHALSIVWMD